jgi:hypothetical protein
MNNLRRFNTEADYSAATLNYPAVSWVTATDNVYFDKSVPAPSFSGLTVYYNITDISQPTELFNGGGGSGSGSGSGGAIPSAMIIDGTAVEVTNTYQFSTTGEHIINYSFADNQIPQMFLSNGDGIKFNTVTKVVIGDAITSIGQSAFASCTSLTSCTIGNSVTYINSVAFGNCFSLASATVNAVDPPQLESYAFGGSTCPIYVPSQSVEEYKGSTSTGWYEYASRIQAIQ